MRKRKNRIVIWLMRLVFIVFAVIFLLPDLSELMYQQKTAAVIESIDSMVQGGTPQVLEPEESHTHGEYETTLEEPSYLDLKEAMKEYNSALKNSNILDIYSFSDFGFDLTKYGFEQDSPVGYVTIDRIDIEMPIYLGSTYDNLSNGFANLAGTSLPVGGVSTNCVLAGHRGWNGAKYLTDIEELQLGDEIRVTNLWETLNYEITAIEIIYPDEISKIAIRKDKDMLTIVTCHPYREANLRYVVYGERKHITEEQKDSTISEDNGDTEVENSNIESHINTEASEQNILSNIGLERKVRLICGVLLVLLFVISFVPKKKRV